MEDLEPCRNLCMHSLDWNYQCDHLTPSNVWHFTIKIQWKTLKLNFLSIYWVLCMTTTEKTGTRWWLEKCIKSSFPKWNGPDLEQFPISRLLELLQWRPFKLLVILNYSKRLREMTMASLMYSKFQMISALSTIWIV